MLSILLKENIIEIYKILDINSLLVILRCNKYCHDLVINNKILDNALIKYYKTLDKEEIVDMISDSYSEDHVFKLFELCLTIYPDLVKSDNLISHALENTYRSDILSYLLKKGSDPNGEIYGESYLEYVIDYASDLEQKHWQDPVEEVAKLLIPIVRTLLEAGANPNYVSKVRVVENTIFHNVCKYDICKCFIEIFLMNDADLYICNNKGKTPFDYLERDDIINITNNLAKICRENMK